MNILVLDSWLREYIKTDATPKQIGEYLSLCSQSVERIEKVGEDYLYDIEITTNRPDCLSVYGIARELSAILPQFGIKATLKKINDQKPEIAVKESLPFQIKNDSKLCHRLLGIVFRNVKLKSSPDFVKKRLESAGVRSLNNLVDITNYIMLEMGHPTHVFDYDRIKTHKFVIRRAKTEEKIVTLDGKTYTLPGGDTVIDDGTGRIIDLPGIMGTENSVVTQESKNILFFLESNDPSQIRKTSMSLGIRTMAAAINEKGPSPETALVTFLRGIQMFKDYAGGEFASDLIDIYPVPLKPKEINLSLDLVSKMMGTDISKKEVQNILTSLGFEIINQKTDLITVSVPHWRYSDVSIPEDLVEEVARIYGYFKLPTNIPPGLNNEPKNPRFFQEERTKKALKYWGFTEVVSYSMIGASLLEKLNLSPQDYLKIANPLTDDLVYMRPIIIGSHLQIAKENLAHFPQFKIFEIANIYISQGENQLPDEIRMLTGLEIGDKFYEVKGLIQSLLEDLGIENIEYKKNQNSKSIFNLNKSTEVLVSGKPIGTFGQVRSKITQQFGINEKITLFDIEFGEVMKYVGQTKKYQPISLYPATIEEMSVVLPKNIETQDIIKTIELSDKLVENVEFLGSFGLTQSFRITYKSFEKTLKGEEVEKIREKITTNLKEKYGTTLKS